MVADDIVGKMTISALDTEMLQVERDNAKPLRIVNAHPARRQRYLSSSGSDLLSQQMQSKLGAKTLADSAKPIVPGGLFWQMQLKLGERGTFQVVDRVGEMVRCWDETIGFVFTPDEPLAHGGTMRVYRSPQMFAVRTRGVGHTEIEASKPLNNSGLEIGSDWKLWLIR